jgi:lysophospholipase L1-like esterase
MSGAHDGLGRVLNPVPPVKPSSVKRLAEIEARLPDAADLILFGDSLAAGWPRELHGQAFPGRRVWNFGLPGDRIQNALWRLGKVATAHLRPREVVLLLGTNNLGDGDPPEAIAAVLRQALALWGDPRPVVLTVPRRGEPPGFRDADRAVLNETLRGELRAFQCATLVDADAALALASVREEPSLQPDLLHLSEAGYRRLGIATAALLATPGSLSA